MCFADNCVNSSINNFPPSRKKSCMQPCIIIKFVLCRSKLSRYEAVTTTLQVPPVERPWCYDDLFLSTWELKWERVTPELVAPVSVITLTLKLVPSPEFGDKLSSVKIDHRTGYLYPGTDMILTGENKKGIILKKQEHYECKILSEATAMKFDDYVDTEGITVESYVVVQYCHFDTIKEIQVPSSTTLCNLGSLLVFSEEES